MQPLDIFNIEGVFLEISCRRVVWCFVHYHIALGAGSQATKESVKKSINQHMKTNPGLHTFL